MELSHEADVKKSNRSYKVLSIQREKGNGTKYSDGESDISKETQTKQNKGGH